MNFFLQLLAALIIIFNHTPSNSDRTIVEADVLQDGKDQYDVTFYHLDLNVSDSSTYISGSVTIYIKPVISELRKALFDFSDLLITDSVKAGNLKAAFIHQDNEISITLPSPAKKGETTPVQIFYHGLGSNIETDGIHNRHVSAWGKTITYTLTESFSALNFFPCKQSLTDKADSVYFFLSTNKNLKAGSNGILTAEVPLPDDRVRYEWKSRYPIAYYLISFAVGDYMDYSYYVNLPGSDDSVLVQNYIYNDSNYLKQNKPAIDMTGDLLVLYSRLFGDYPFCNEKYGHCLAPFSGGMEHQTMTTLVNFSFLLVAHELAHQWFGDHVTCSTWQDIWINEGFASYGEYLAYQFLISQSNADKWITDCNNFVKSDKAGSVFVPESFAENEGRIFNSRLSYKKGASIIHMIRQEVGNDSLFFDILTTFLSKYGNGNASGDDFRNHLEDKTAKDWVQFFNQWYYGEGYPVHTIRWFHRNDTLYINSLQTTSSVTPFFNLLIEFRVTGEETDTLVAFRQDANYNQWQIYLPGKVSNIEPDPRKWLLADLSDFGSMDGMTNDSLFVIVPNPASDKVLIKKTINNSFDKYTVFIINSEGKIIRRLETSLPAEEINVNSYPAGMYFVLIKSGSLTLQKKLIIN